MAGTKHFSRMNYNVLRGMRELLSHRSLSDLEWVEIRAFFGNTCAFCGCV
jgi:acetone carboxylase gamma subunit